MAETKPAEAEKIEFKPEKCLTVDAFRVDEVGDSLEIFEAQAGRFIRVPKQFAKISKPEGSRYQRVMVLRGKFELS